MDLRRVVVTGGVACGKSTVLDWLRDQLSGKVHVHDSDAAVHRIYERREVAQRLRERWGEEVVDVNGRLERARVREIVLADEQQRRWLEELIHPLVTDDRQALEQRLMRDFEDCDKVHWILAEIPLWYEAEVSWAVDSVIVVGSSNALQRTRLLEDRGLGEDQIEALLAAQLPMDTKLQRADYVCWNDGSREHLTRQLKLLIKQLDI